MIDFVLLAGAIALTVVVFRRLGTALGVYSTGLLVIATAAPSPTAARSSRACRASSLVDFPLFIAGASLLRDAPAKRGPIFGVLTALARRRLRHVLAKALGRVTLSCGAGAGP